MGLTIANYSKDKDKGSFKDTFLWSKGIVPFSILKVDFPKSVLEYVLISFQVAILLSVDT